MLNIVCFSKITLDDDICNSGNTQNNTDSYGDDGKQTGEIAKGLTTLEA
jgi:hypothetical protein